MGMRQGNPTRTGEHSAFTCVRLRLKPTGTMKLAPRDDAPLDNPGAALVGTCINP